MRQQLPRSLLLRRLLGGTLRPSHKFRPACTIFPVQTDLYREGLFVFRSGFVHQHVRRLRDAQTLQRFLQSRFEIVHRQCPAVALHPFELRRQNFPQNEFAGGFHSAVQVDRRQNRLERVHQQPRLRPSAAFLFAASQPQVMPQLESLRYSDQVPLTHHVGAKLGKLTLAKLRESMKQSLARNKPQNRGSQKFQLLVVVDSIFVSARLLRLLLARLRAVSDRLFDHSPAAKMIAQRRFQRGDFPFFHDCTAASKGCVLGAATVPGWARILISRAYRECRQSTGSAGPSLSVPHLPHWFPPWLNPPPGWRPSAHRDICSAYPKPPTAGRRRSDRAAAGTHQSTSSDFLLRPARLLH